MQVTAATMSDVDAIVHVEATGAHRPWSRAKVEGTLASSTGFGVIATHEGQIVGHLLGTHVADEGELYTLVVSPAMRRRGTARALIVAAVAIWQRAGCHDVFLEVRDDNHAAQALYTQLGWSSCGRRPGYYHDGADAIVMRLILETGT